jgi:hypothetical protein
MKKFIVDGVEIYADDFIDGVLVEPRLPVGFMVEEHNKRPPHQLKFWWHRPFILIDRGQTSPLVPANEEIEAYVLKIFLQKWPAGAAFDLLVLDGIEQLAPTNRGRFSSLNAALVSAKAWLIAAENIN